MSEKHNRFIQLGSGLLLSVALLGCSSSPIEAVSEKIYVRATASPTHMSTRQKWILYSRQLQSPSNPNVFQYDLFYTELDKLQKEHRLTTSDANEMNAQISPDGKSIALYSDQITTTNPLGFNHILKMDLQTKQVEQLTEDDGSHYYDPTWSPDGKTIAFKKDEGEGKIDTNERGRIWLMDSDGKNKRELPVLYNGQPLRGEMWKPAFRADGESLFITVGVDRNGVNTSHLYQVAIDSGVAEKLTSDDGSSHWFPAPHPKDVNLIAFTSNKPGADQIYLLDIEQRITTQITYHEVQLNDPLKTNLQLDINDPAWNVDGTKITAVASYVLDVNAPDLRQYDVVEVDPKTGSFTKITNTGNTELSPWYRN